MRNLLLWYNIIICALLTVTSICVNAQAAWTIVVYMEAYSHLAPDALVNLKQMQVVGSTSNVNVLVQVNLPNNTISAANNTSSEGQTFRYVVQKGELISVGLPSLEMGIDPVHELVTTMAWAKASYPADNYHLILWSDGSGALDPERSKKRGILFDDATNTFVSNSGMSTVLAQIQAVLGQKLAILHMDACLMAGIEEVYQIEKYAQYYIGSENTEPGLGLPYDRFLQCLKSYPRASLTAAHVAQCAVKVYGSFYASQDTTHEYTLSAIDLSRVDAIVTNLNNVVKALQVCYKISPSLTKTLLQTTISKAILANSNDGVMTYFDLYSLLSNLSTIIIAWTEKGVRGEPKLATQYRNALIPVVNALSPLILTRPPVPNVIDAAILARVAGTSFSGMHGLSIYAPIAPATVFPTYGNLAFAKNTLWSQFLQMLQGTV